MREGAGEVRVRESPQWPGSWLAEIRPLGPPPGGAGEKAAQAQSGSWPAACCQAPVP